MPCREGEPRLTSREWEVLELMRRKMTTAQIARTLVVSPATVRSHVAAILRKLRVAGPRSRSKVARPRRAPESACSRLSFLAGEVGELAGVSGNTIGQWARWGYIRASQSAGDPHVYSVEDVTEAAMVHTLLERGVSHAQVRRAIAHLAEYGDWPLSEAPLAVTDGRARGSCCASARAPFALSPRGWQLMVGAAAAGGRPPAAQDDLEADAGSVDGDAPPPAAQRRRLRRCSRRRRLRRGGPRRRRARRRICGRSRASWACGRSRARSYALDLVDLFDPLPFAVLVGRAGVAAVLAGPPAGRARRAADDGRRGRDHAAAQAAAGRRSATSRSGTTWGPRPSPAATRPRSMSLALALVIVSPPRWRPLAAAAGGLLTVATVFSLLVARLALPERRGRRLPRGHGLGVPGHRRAAARDAAERWAAPALAAAVLGLGGRAGGLCCGPRRPSPTRRRTRRSWPARWRSPPARWCSAVASRLPQRLGRARRQRLPRARG